MSVVETVLREPIRVLKSRSDEGCKDGHVTEKELGRGEQGIAYAMMHNKTGKNVSRTHVLKQSMFTEPDSNSKWESEAKLSKLLGIANLGPIIYDYWICKGSGYILMERMANVVRGMRDEEGRPAYEKSKAGNDIDHLDRVPESILRDFVDKLEIMIGAGYIHFDNHPGNLGVRLTKEGELEGLLFDFGYTREVPDMTNEDKYNALQFSIAQILEHMPTPDLYDNYLFKILVSIDKGTYIYGSLVPSATDADIAAFRSYYTLSNLKVDFDTDITPLIAAPRGYNRDLYVGAKLYNYFFNLPKRPLKYDWPSYSAIYAIRQNLPIPPAVRGASYHNLAYPAAAAAAGSGAGGAPAAAGAGTRARAEESVLAAARGSGKMGANVGTTVMTTRSRVAAGAGAGAGKSMKNVVKRGGRRKTRKTRRNRK